MNNLRSGDVDNESLPTLEELRRERDPPILGPPGHLHERDPLTVALLQEAGIPAWLHSYAIHHRPPPSARQTPPGTTGTPASSSPAPSPTSTTALDRLGQRPRTPRHNRAISRARIWATGGPHISAEAGAMAVIIGTVLARRRRSKDWHGWPQEAQEYIALCIPQKSKREHLDEYARFRSLIRAHRRSWKLAEHITDLDDILDRAHDL